MPAHLRDTCAWLSSEALALSSTRLTLSSALSALVAPADASCCCRASRAPSPLSMRCRCRSWRAPLRAGETAGAATADAALPIRCRGGATVSDGDAPSAQPGESFSGRGRSSPDATYIFTWGCCKRGMHEHELLFRLCEKLAEYCMHEEHPWQHALLKLQCCLPSPPTARQGRSHCLEQQRRGQRRCRYIEGGIQCCYCCLPSTPPYTALLSS